MQEHYWTKSAQGAHTAAPTGRRGSEIVEDGSIPNTSEPPQAITEAIHNTEVAPAEWSGGQEAALVAIERWRRNPGGQQVFYLAGPAGSGKTTLARQIGDEHKGTVAYGTLTGKAAHVLRKKGCAQADTLDSQMYSRPAWWRCQLGCEKPPCRELCPSARIHYGRKSLNLGGPLSDASLIIVDEASMIGPEMGRDLLAFGKPILVIGDPYQLPPIQGRGFFTRGKPDVLLTEIHRQAQGNPIIQMATIVRSGGWLRHGPRGASEVVPSVEPRAWLDYDVVVAGLHKTRKFVNREFRRMLGLTGPPQVGERVLCTRNSRPKGLMNGEVWTVRHVDGVHDGFVYMTVVDERQKPIDVCVLLDLFENDVAEQPDSMGEAFTWGYCLTCHKAQGSEWGDVLVFDEGGAFRDPKDPACPNRWRYTAITRASDAVTIVRRLP